VRPGFAVDGRAGRCVADAEFGGELPVSQAVGPARPKLPYFSAGQLGSWITVANGAVIVAVAAAAPRLESGPDVIAGRIDRGPILCGFTAISAGVTAGRPPGFGHATVPYGIGRVCCLQGGPGQLISTRAGTAAAAPADHGERSADRAALSLVFGRATRASARLGIARVKRADPRGDFCSAVAPAQGCPVSSPVRGELLHFPYDGEPAVFVSRVDNAPHDSDCNRQNRHSAGATPLREIGHTG
jgi:hypothetical protein